MSQEKRYGAVLQNTRRVTEGVTYSYRNGRDNVLELLLRIRKRLLDLLVSGLSLVPRLLIAAVNDCPGSRDAVAVGQQR